MLFTFYFITFVVVTAMLFLFHRKMALQLQYLELKAKKTLTPIAQFLRFDWSDAKARNSRKEAFLLFPMLYGIPFEEGEREDLQQIKFKIKRSHIGIYFCLIVFISLGVLSEKILPA